MLQGGSEPRCSVFFLKEPNNIYSSIYCAHAAWNNRPLSKQTDKHAYSNAVCGNVSNVSFLISRPTDRREAVLLPALQQGLRRQVQSQGSPTNPFGCEKIPMQELLQNLLQDVSSAQAWGIWLLRSTLNWDTFPTTTKKKELCYVAIFFSFFGEKKKRDCQGITPSWFIPKTEFIFVFWSFFKKIFLQMSIQFHFRRMNCILLMCLAVLLCLQPVSSISCHVLAYLCYSCTFLHV